MSTSLTSSPSSVFKGFYCVIHCVSPEVGGVEILSKKRVAQCKFRVEEVRETGYRNWITSS